MIKSIILIVLITALLQGCATPAGNAAFVGAAAGAATAAIIYNHRPLHCHQIIGNYIGHDRRGYPIYSTRTICR